MGGSSKKQTIGYRYSFFIHMGLCRGPVDEIVQVKIDDLVAYDKPLTDDKDDVLILKHDLFGGDEKEGGVVGGMSVLMGKADQDISTRTVTDVRMYGNKGATGDAVGQLPIKSFLTGLVSSFRGITTVFYRGQISVNNPYPKTWKFRVRRTNKGWQGDAPWYPDKAAIWMYEGDQIIQAMNPAHIIYECITNQAWGKGLPASAIDEASFVSAANTLCAEGFGLCLRWTRTNKLSEFIQSVVDHVNAMLYVSRQTGLLTLRLIREDYDAASLPLFDVDSGLLSITEDQKASPNESVNEIVLTYHSPIDDGDRMVRAHNLAAFQADGAVRSTKSNYAGLPTAELALRVAQRDLRLQSAGLRRLKLVMDRRAWKIEPGGVFRIRDVRRGIDNIVMRAGRVEDSTLTDGKISVAAVQDVFGLPATSFMGYQPSQWVPPDRSARVPEQRRLVEASYRDIFQGVGASSAAEFPIDGAAFMSLAQQPTTLSPTYTLHSRAEGEDYGAGTTSAWTPTGLLVAAIGPGARSIFVEDVTGWGYITAGSAALIDDEMVRVDAFNAATGEIVIARGCVDTIPAGHAVGARIWFFDENAGSDERDYVAGETVHVKVLTQTSSATLPLGSAPEDSITLDHRFSRPYPPGAVQVNGLPFYAPDVQAGDLAFTWSHRNRVSQQDQVVDHAAGSVAPEAGTTYTIRLYGDTGALVRTQAGITDTAWTYDAATIEADGVTTEVGVEIESIRDGLASYQTYSFKVPRVRRGGFNRAFNRAFNNGAA